MPDEGAAEGPQMLINPLGIESMPKSAGWPGPFSRFPNPVAMEIIQRGKCSLNCPILFKMYFLILKKSCSGASVKIIIFNFTL